MNLIQPAVLWAADEWSLSSLLDSTETLLQIYAV